MSTIIEQHATDGYAMLQAMRTEAARDPATVKMLRTLVKYLKAPHALATMTPDEHHRQIVKTIVMLRQLNAMPADLTTAKLLEILCDTSDDEFMQPLCLYAPPGMFDSAVHAVSTNTGTINNTATLKTFFTAMVDWGHLHVYKRLPVQPGRPSDINADIFMTDEGKASGSTSTKCAFFPLGTCRHGDKCAFTHDLRETIQQQQQQGAHSTNGAEPCRNWANEGCKNKGTQCPYSHEAPGRFNDQYGPGKLVPFGRDRKPTSPTRPNPAGAGKAKAPKGGRGLCTDFLVGDCSKGNHCSKGVHDNALLKKLNSKNGSSVNAVSVEEQVEEAVQRALETAGIRTTSRD